MVAPIVGKMSLPEQATEIVKESAAATAIEVLGRNDLVDAYLLNVKYVTGSDTGRDELVALGKKIWQGCNKKWKEDPQAYPVCKSDKGSLYMDYTVKKSVEQPMMYDTLMMLGADGEILLSIGLVDEKRGVVGECTNADLVHKSIEHFLQDIKE